MSYDIPQIGNENVIIIDQDQCVLSFLTTTSLTSFSKSHLNFSRIMLGQSGPFPNFCPDHGKYFSSEKFPFVFERFLEKEYLMERIQRQFREHQHVEEVDKEVFQPKKHTLNPMITGSTILGVVYNKGVMLASDTLCSYGSMAKYRSLVRVRKVNDFTIMGATGEYSDFQYLLKKLNDLVDDEVCDDEDNEKRKPGELLEYLNTIMYYRRNRFDPYYNQVVVAGWKDNKPFLGCSDLIGTKYKSHLIATGFGAYFALPILRDFYKQKGNIAGVTEEDARKVLEKCLRVLFYRDARTINRIMLGKVDESGTKFSNPYEVKGKWDFKGF